MAKSKFNVSSDKSKRTYNGIVFDSAMEMRFYRDWCIPKINDGEIVECERQVKYILQPKFIHNGTTIQPITYVADFVITYSNGVIDVIDIKGCPDSVALLKRKLFWYTFPDINYIWITYSKIDGGWVEYFRIYLNNDSTRSHDVSPVVGKKLVIKATGVYNESVPINACEWQTSDNKWQFNSSTLGSIAYDKINKITIRAILQYDFDIIGR